MINNEKQPWEMTEEEQKKYYDDESNKLIDITISQIIRNKILYNHKLREKIKKKIKELITKELEKETK